MATKSVKDDIIRVRVTKEHKEKLKKLAEENNTTVSQILSVATESLIKEHEEKVKNKEIIEKRFVATEQKLQNVKKKMINKNIETNKTFMDKLLVKIRGNR